MDPTVYQGSKLAMRSSASLFGLPPTDVSSISSNYITVSPTYSVKDQTSPIQFTIPPSSLQYIDLASSFLYVKVKLLKADGTNIEATDMVAPSSMFFYSMFKNCIVSLNGTTISDCNNTYAYQSGIPALLMNGEGGKQSELTSMLFYRDTTPDVFDVAKNDGFKIRQDLAATSKVFDMTGAIPASLFQQDKYLPPYCAVSVELTRQAPEFCLDCATTSKSYTFQIEMAQLIVKMHTLNPEIVARHNKMFAKEKAQIPLRDAMVRTISIPTGSQSFASQTLLNGKLPTTIVLGMVSSKAMNGSLDRDPWNFQHFGLTSITLTSENDPALTRAIDVDFKNNVHMLGYQKIFKALGRYNDGNFISRQDYPKGNVMFLFDLQDGIFSEFHTVKTGQLKVTLQFAEATTEPITLLMFASFEQLLELDEYRNAYIRS